MFRPHSTASTSSNKSSCFNSPWTFCSWVTLLITALLSSTLLTVEGGEYVIPNRKDGMRVGKPRRVRKDDDIFVGPGGKKLLECDYEGKLAHRISGAIMWTFAPTVQGSSAGTIVSGWDPYFTHGRLSEGDPSAPKTNEEIEAEAYQKYHKETPPAYERFTEHNVQLLQDGFFKGNKIGAASLLVKNFFQKMQGNYTCKVVMADGQHLQPASYNLVMAEITTPRIIQMDPIKGNIKVFEGMDNFIECEVFCIPHAVITWKLDNVLITEGVEQAPKHDYDPNMVISTLKLNPSRYRHRKMLECLATNEAVLTKYDQNAIGESLREPATQQAYLDVKYPSDKPIIAFNADEWYSDGEDLTVACKVGDLGLPRAELTLKLPDGTSIVGKHGEMTMLASHYILESSMIVRPNHDGEKIECFADSEEPTLNQESFKTLKVAFGPSSVKILGNRPVKEGTLIKLICSPVGTNPMSRIEWIEPDYVNLPEHARCPIGNICNHIKGRYTIEDERVMALKADWMDNGARITCKATNEETWHMAEKYVTLDVSHRPVWNGTENDRIVSGAMGETVRLDCNVIANPAPHRYEWQYLGNDQSKVYDPCYWTVRFNVWPCEDHEQCEWKKWVKGDWVAYDDPCGPEVTPPPVPIVLNADYSTLDITIEMDANGKDNFGLYLCTATNDHGSVSFKLEIEDSEYAMKRTTELMVIVGVACLLGLLIIVAVIIVVIVSTIRKRRLVRYPSDDDFDPDFVDDDGEKVYDIRLNNGSLHPYYQQHLHQQQQQQLLRDSNGGGNYSVVNGNVSNVTASNGNVSYDHDDSYGNVSINNDEIGGSPADVSSDNDHDDSGSSGIAVDNSLDSVVNQDEEEEEEEETSVPDENLVPAQNLDAS